MIVGVGCCLCVACLLVPQVIMLFALFVVVRWLSVVVCRCPPCLLSVVDGRLLFGIRWFRLMLCVGRRFLWLCVCCCCVVVCCVLLTCCCVLAHGDGWRLVFVVCWCRRPMCGCVV